MGDYQAALKRETLNIEQTRKVMGVSRRTIYNWIRGNKLEYYRTPGGNIRIFSDQLIREHTKPWGEE